MPVVGVDDGVGRTLPGAWILPANGVVGPVSGFDFTTLPIGYMGAMGGNRLTEVAGVIVSNDEANASLNILIPQYVYKSKYKKMSFASSFMLAYRLVGSEHFQTGQWYPAKWPGTSGCGILLRISPSQRPARAVAPTGGTQRPDTQRDLSMANSKSLLKTSLPLPSVTLLLHVTPHSFRPIL
jgi:hypothetical protein